MPPWEPPPCLPVAAFDRPPGGIEEDEEEEEESASRPSLPRRRTIPSSGSMAGCRDNVCRRISARRISEMDEREGLLKIECHLKASLNTHGVTVVISAFPHHSSSWRDFGKKKPYSCIVQQILKILK